MGRCAFDAFDGQLGYVVTVVLVFRVTKSQAVVVRRGDIFFFTDQFPESVCFRIFLSNHLCSLPKEYLTEKISSKYVDAVL